MKRHKLIPPIEGQYQQGDVALNRLEDMPPGKQKIVSRGRIVLAEGEKTGHAHVIEVASEDDAQLIKIGEKMLLRLYVTSEVVHQEHKPVVLEPGLYEVGAVHEYDYYSQMTRRVAD